MRIWTLAKHLEKRLDVNYIRMLCAVLNKSWKQYPKKTAAVRILTSHPASYSRKARKICWSLLKK